MGRLINQGTSMKAALDTALKDTTLRERYFTTPCALQVRTSFSAPGRGNHWDPGSAQVGARNRNRSAGAGDGGGESGKGQYSKKQKKGAKGGKGDKGKGKGFGKGASHTPDGRQICFSFNSEFERCRGKGCTRVHCCRLCFGKHPMHNCTGEVEPKPAGPAAAEAAGATAGG